MPITDPAERVSLVYPEIFAESPDDECEASEYPDQDITADEFDPAEYEVEGQGSQGARDPKPWSVVV
jgi:hypothetical protein